MNTLSRITLFSLLSISLSHAMEEKDIIPEKKGNFRGSGENIHFMSKAEIKKQEEKFYTIHTREALNPIFHILVTGYEPLPDDETNPGKYGNIDDIIVSSESEAHTIMKMRMKNFFEDKKSILFKKASGTKDFIKRGSKLSKDSFHQYFVLKASKNTDNTVDCLKATAFYTSMLSVACTSFCKNAVPLISSANQEYKKSLDARISSLEADILILNQKHGGEISALKKAEKKLKKELQTKNQQIIQKDFALGEFQKLSKEQNDKIKEYRNQLKSKDDLINTQVIAYQSCDTARSRWKTGLIVVGVAGAVAYKAGYINTDKMSEHADMAVAGMKNIGSSTFGYFSSNK